MPTGGPWDTQMWPFPLDSEYEEVLATSEPLPAYSVGFLASAEPFPSSTRFSGTLKPSHAITFTSDQSGAFLKLDFSGETPTVWVDPSLAWDVAAKQFWNAVHRTVGKPAPFPD